MKYPGFEGLMSYEDQSNSSQKIINAAIYEFAVKGYVQSTTKAIAKRAGVSEALVFKKFGNKQKLLGAVSTEIVANRIPALFKYKIDEIFYEDKEFDFDGFLLIIREKFHHFANHIGYFKIVVLEISFNSDETTQTIKAMLNDVLLQVDKGISQLQKNGVLRDDIPPRAVIRSFVGMLHFLLLEKNLLDPSINIDEALTMHLNILLKGVGSND